jgi:predicted nucleotidyltransferase
MVHDLEIVRSIITKYANDVRKVLPVKKVILFGSYAKGTADEGSDIDVCFFITNLDNTNYIEIMILLRRISRGYSGFYISPIVFHVSDIEDENPFVMEVLSTGIEIL